MTILNNPYQQMARLDQIGVAYRVNVKTTHNGVEMEIEDAGVISHDGDWLALQCHNDRSEPMPPLWLHKKGVAALAIEEL